MQQDAAGLCSSYTTAVTMLGHSRRCIPLTFLTYTPQA